MAVMIVLTYVAQVACLAIGLAAGAAGVTALMDGRFAAGAGGLLAFGALGFGEHVSRRLRDYLAERDRVG